MAVFMGPDIRRLYRIFSNLPQIRTQPMFYGITSFFGKEIKELENQEILVYNNYGDIPQKVTVPGGRIKALDPRLGKIFLRY